jgi:multidrug efflux system membrane fusion protein
LCLGVAGYFAVQYDVLDSVTSYFSGPRIAGGRIAATPPVRVATAELKDMPVMVHTIGTVLANSVVNIKSQVDGPLVDAMFKEGQMVKKGDLLFRIDPAPFEAALRQSQAQEARDRATLASAQADAERAMMLADRGIVSTQQRDQLVASAKALAATVDADVAAVDRAKLNLGYTTIRSPINGKTGPLLVYPGNQVHANDAAGLITITEIQPVKISFNLPQGDLPQLQSRMIEDQLVAGVTARSDVASAASEAQEMALPVKVDFIGNAVDPRTGTIELRATSANPDLRLVPGELVDVSVRLETLNRVTTVPREAVNVGQNGDYVFVVDGSMKAQMRPVRVLFQDQSMAALGSGVQPGEQVIVDGQLRVTPGVTVAIVAQPANGDPAANADATATGAAGAPGADTKTAAGEKSPS